jgi:hypothetical protein
MAANAVASGLQIVEGNLKIVEGNLRKEWLLR